MKYVKLGNTGLSVSRIALGCMTFGVPEQGNHAWSLPEDESRPIIKQALDAGITFFDTANVYSLGSSEEIVGRALADYASREDIVIATKVFSRMRPGPYGAGLSRKAIFDECDASLRRLGVDYIDLYQIHRWDYDTPIEETMEALHDLVRAGKVRYIGASSMHAWQFAKAQYVAAVNGWTPFVSMQDHYNLLMREEEREMHPMCQDMGVAVIPWSPLARGRVARPWGTETNRTQSDPSFRNLAEEANAAIVGAVEKVAGDRGISMAQAALAWMLSKPAVTAPIIGASKADQLEQAIAAVEVTLDDGEIASLEEHYTPRDNVGFR